MDKTRLIEAYKHLQRTGRILTQRQFADAIGKTEGTVSKAMKGDKKALTKNLVVAVCVAFPEISLDWLANGKGEMLTALNAPQTNNAPPADNLSTDDANGQQHPTDGPVDAIIQLYSSLVKNVETELQEVRALRSELSDLRTSLRESIDEQKNVTAALRRALVNVVDGSSLMAADERPQSDTNQSNINIKAK